jgi:hypothetical protein
MYRRAGGYGAQARPTTSNADRQTDHRVMNIDQLVADEPLSPELVLVLPPELRAEAIARLSPPSRPSPRPYIPELVVERVLEYVAESVSDRVAERVPEYPPGEDSLLLDAQFLRSLGTVAAARVGQLGLIALVVTLATLAMSAVAHHALGDRYIQEVRPSPERTATLTRQLKPCISGRSVGEAVRWAC